MQMTGESLILERIAFALGRLDLAPSYRELLLEVAGDHLKAQFDHYQACSPLFYLPFLCCEGNGVNSQHAVGVASAWFLLQIAAYLLDKVEDQELDVVEHSFSGEKVCTNLSTGMIFVAQWILNHLELDFVDAGAAWDIQRAFQETVLSVCSGQHLDLSIARPDLSTCWQIAEAKSGSAFALACYVGTRTATRQSDRLSHMENLGRYLGTIVQISDDIDDLEQDTPRCDKTNTISPLANAYLSHIGATIREVPEVSAKENMKTPLVRDSLILYLRLEALKYGEMARKELNAVPLVSGPRDQILAIINHFSWLGANVN